jgi:cytochrome P450
VAALLRDRRLRQGSAESLAALRITEGLLADWMGMSLLDLEGEPHGRLCRIVSQAFTPRAVDALRPAMRAVARLRGCPSRLLLTGFYTRPIVVVS